MSRFERVLDHATSVHYVTNEGYYGDDSLFTFCNQVMLGFAAMRGRGLDEDPNLLVIWDGEPGATGGTGELVEAWREEFNEPEIIDSKDILAHLKEPEPVRVHSGETVLIFDQVLGSPVSPSAQSRQCFLQMFRHLVGLWRIKLVPLWNLFMVEFPI